MRGPYFMEYYVQIKVIYEVCVFVCALNKRAEEVYKNKHADASAGAYNHKTTTATTNKY